MDVPEGWRISSHKNGSVIYVATNSSQTFPDCPEGLTDGFVATMDQVFLHDPTFQVECHSEEVRDNCQDCKVMEVTADNLIATELPYILGNYTRKDQLNGHPVYYKDQESITNLLYFRKDGKVIHRNLTYEAAISTKILLLCRHC